MYCCQEWGREGGDLWWCHSLWLGVLPVCPPLTVSQPFCVILSTSHELQIPLSHSAHFLVNLSEPFCPLFGQPLWAIQSTFWSTSLSHPVHFWSTSPSHSITSFCQPLWAILFTSQFLSTSLNHSVHFQVSVNFSEPFCSLPIFCPPPSFCQPLWLWAILSTS